MRLVQARAADELHHEVRLVVVDAEVDDRDAVADARACAISLASRSKRWRLDELVGQRLVHDLDRDRATELQALAAIDAAHRALGDRLDDLVAAVEHGPAEVVVVHAPNDSSVWYRRRMHRALLALAARAAPPASQGEGRAEPAAGTRADRVADAVGDRGRRRARRDRAQLVGVDEYSEFPASREGAAEGRQLPAPNLEAIVHAAADAS